MEPELLRGIRMDDDQPCVLVYDMVGLERRAHELKEALPFFDHCLALKAAPFPRLLKKYAEWGFGFEAASYPEGLCAALANPDSTVLFDSPAKTKLEISMAEERGWILSANSLGEVARLQKPCSLRINPKVGEGGVAMTSVATVGSRFGVGFDELPAELPSHLQGLHVHIGSHGLSLEQMGLAAARVVSLAKRYPQVTSMLST